ncbi:MAG TPA: thiamine pyrophosphate-dependent enzyme [Streptosporangiaceae bacterium]|nr:thiamine pyrophosphate-dependent enzyme [Streptosporangiaceae bacterium]
MAQDQHTQPVTHGGAQAVAAARAHGARTIFTLSGGHVFPVYDGAVKADPPMPILDVRHEQTAVFAAEATARLTRAPGFAVLTAGPGVTNGISAITTACFNGSSVVVLAGRAPDNRWGSGSLQEFDHPVLLGPITKRAWTEHSAAGVGAAVSEAFRLATARHRGPVFLDVSLEALFGTPDPGPPAPAAGPASPGAAAAGSAAPGASSPSSAGASGLGRSAAPRAPAAPPGAAASQPPAESPDAGHIAQIADLLTRSARPVLVLGSDVWLDGAEDAARGAAEELRLPVVANGQGRGILPAGHDLLVTRARSVAFGEADLVIVAGTPLDFRLGYGAFGGKNGTPPAHVVHVADAPGQIAGHLALAGSAAGDLTAFFTGLASAAQAGNPQRPWTRSWLPRLQEACRSATAADAALLTSDASPIHPMRIYGELTRLLDPDAVVIGDGGDFVSYAGKYIEPSRPGGWLDPGPYGCLGTGLGYAIAARICRPSAQVVLLLGDGAAGFSLMDVDTLVRHRLPVVMICGNNGIWGLEKHPMQALYGYDVAADLQPECRYDQVVSALGGAGELVTRPGAIAPALRRAFGSGVPYLVNVATDPRIAYPRSTSGI